MKKFVRRPILHAAAVALTVAAILGHAAAVRTQDVTAQAGTPPAAGDIIINEYMADNDANGNDFVELLVMRDGVDLRGLRFSDNEYSTATGLLNNNEAVFIFGNDAFLSNVPRGTLIAVYQLAAGVVTDTVVDPTAGDWKMVLAPGTGITGSTDGLGGSFNAGLAVGGEALYLYLPGPNGNSSGTDNIYLDFVSFEADGGDPPPGMVDLNLPSVADNAYYTGNTAAGNDLAANWVRYDNAPNASTTPGEPNPGQDLTTLRNVTPTAGVTVTQSGGSTAVAEGGLLDSYTIALNTAPAGAVEIQATSDARTEVSTDGVIFAHSALLTLTTTAPGTITVRAVDDVVFQGNTSSTITHSITTSGDPAYSDALTPVASVLASVTDNDTPITPIHDIQGPGAASPIVGTVIITRGIVTGIKSNAFFIQEPDASVDGLAETSEGIQVFTGSAPTVTRGDLVQVGGTVSEFVPAADPFQPPLTEISGPSVSVLSSGNALPTPIEITVAMSTAPNAEALLERLEGMRVSVPSLTVTGPTLAGSSSEPNASSTSSGVFYGVVTGVPRPFREAGIDIHDPLPPGSPCCVPRFDGNAERLRVDSDAQAGAALLDLTSGVVITGIVGPLDYGFRTYTVLPDAGSATVTTPNAVFTAVPAASTDELTIVGFNMERFFDKVNDPGIGEPVLTDAALERRLSKASLIFRNVIRLPDVAGLVEIENLSVLQTLASRVNDDAVAAGLTNPNYQAFLVEGNDPGGIDVGFLVKPSRVSVIAVHQEGKDATYVNPNNGSAELLNDRPPLVLDAQATRSDGSPFAFTVVVNHLRSLLGVDDAADGARVRAKRRAQGEFLATLLQDMRTANPGVRVVAIGDFNAFEVNDGYVDVIGTAKGAPAPANQVVLASSDLVTPDFVNLVDSVPGPQRYSFVFDGNAQVLDHALVNDNLLSWVSRFAFGRVDADFPDTARNDQTKPERLSDHDPTITYVALGAARIVGRIVNTGPRVGGQMTIDVQVSNIGGGNALGVTIDSLALRTLSGSGTVTPATALPIAVGSLAPGQSTVVSIVVNVPDGVSRFGMIENGSAADPGGAVSHFMIGTATSSIVVVH
jgi:hypothetical protein